MGKFQLPHSQISRFFIGRIFLGSHSLQNPSLGKIPENLTQQKCWELREKFGKSSMETDPRKQRSRSQISHPRKAKQKKSQRKFPKMEFPKICFDFLISFLDFSLEGFFWELIPCKIQLWKKSWKIQRAWNEPMDPLPANGIY